MKYNFINPCCVVHKMKTVNETTISVSEILSQQTQNLLNVLAKEILYTPGFYFLNRFFFWQNSNKTPLFLFSFCCHVICLGLPVHGKAQQWPIPWGTATAEQD